MIQLALISTIVAVIIKLIVSVLASEFVQYNVPSVIKIHDIVRDMKHLFILLPS